MMAAGWDGGGTGTTVVCVSRDGSVLSRAGFGPLNLNGAEEAVVRATVRNALAWMRGVGECESLCVGAAGISNPDAAARLQSLLAQEGYTGRLTLAGDHDIALRGAVGGTGVVLIAGTGSICCGRNGRGETARAGGGGHLLDDGGSGYAIGRDVLAAVLRSLDGRSAPTRLSEGVAQALGAATREVIIGYVYHEGRGKADIARFSTVLAPACEQGDAAALAIARRAADELLALLEAVTRRLSLPDARVALLGSALTRCAPVREALCAAVEARLPEVKIIPPLADAATGAAQMALEQWKEHQLG